MSSLKKRLLIAEPSQQIIDLILQFPEAKNYDIVTVRSGPDCLKKINEFQPELIYMDLMLPQMHAIEILKMVRESEDDHKVGVIIVSFQAMIQNYNSAIDHGADYFLIKPYDVEKLFTLIQRFFRGELKPDSFSMKEPFPSTCYHPLVKTFSSYIRFWGTRGSNPVAGPEYVRYGGNTCCLEIRYENDLIVIDAGTGIRQLGETLLTDQVQNVHLFVGHMHWDHIGGFPFFSPLYHKNHNITIWAPVGFDKNAKQLFSDMLNYGYFPIRLDEMHSKVAFKELRDGKPIHIGNLVVETHTTNHPGPTLGFKITSPKRKIGYVTDNEVLFGYHGHPNEITLDHPLLIPHLSLIDFFKDCDLFIHEAQYFPREYFHRVGWGHSSMPNATVLIKHINCPEWIITHHDPNHTDHDLQIKSQLHHDILHECGLDCHFHLAYDSLMLPL